MRSRDDAARTRPPTPRSASPALLARSRRTGTKNHHSAPPLPPSSPRAPFPRLRLARSRFLPARPPTAPASSVPASSYSPHRTLRPRLPPSSFARLSPVVRARRPRPARARDATKPFVSFLAVASRCARPRDARDASKRRGLSTRVTSRGKITRRARDDAFARANSTQFGHSEPHRSPRSIRDSKARAEDFARDRGSRLNPKPFLAGGGPRARGRAPQTPPSDAATDVEARRHGPSHARWVPGGRQGEDDGDDRSDADARQPEDV